MIKFLRLFLIGLILLLSWFYYTESLSDYVKHRNFQYSEAYFERTNNEVLIVERLSDYCNKSWLIYLAFLLPSVLILVLAFLKPSSDRVIFFLKTICSIGLVVLIWYIYRATHGYLNFGD